MKRFFKTAAFVAVGIAVGSSGTQVLRAQSKLPIVTVSEIEVKDMEAYKQWLPPVQKGIVDAGGKYLAGGFNKTTTLIGAPPPNRVVISSIPIRTPGRSGGTTEGKRTLSQRRNSPASAFMAPRALKQNSRPQSAEATSVP